MAKIILLVLLFCTTTVLSILLLGDRKLISGNLLDPKNILNLIFNWKFILAMLFAVMTRFTFVLINNALLKVPHLAGASTTLTIFITTVSYIFIVIANHLYLHERLNLQQVVGAIIILLGVAMMFK